MGWGIGLHVNILSEGIISADSLGPLGNFVEKSCPSCELMNGAIPSSHCEEAAAATSTLAAKGWDDVKVINCA